jgi:hypothetical protein
LRGEKKCRPAGRIPVAARETLALKRRLERTEIAPANEKECRDNPSLDPLRDDMYWLQQQ